MAATMVLGTVSMAFAEDGTVQDGDNLYFVDVPENEVHYTIAGGFAPGGWQPLNTANEMSETLYEGVYSIQVDLKAYNEAEPWNNQFKVLKIDDLTSAVSPKDDGTYDWGGNGWTESLCLGTDVWDDNQSQFCIKNPVDMTATIYVDTNTGAVVVKGTEKNEKDKDVAVNEPYSVSWVGLGEEQKYVDVKDIPTTEWAKDKVKVDSIPTDIEAKNDALFLKATDKDLSDEALYEDGVKYTVAGGCAPNGWSPLSSINEMKESDIKGVYTIDMKLPAWNADEEWNNRFKILRLDDITCAAGWTGNMCMGTDVWDDNQTVIRVENPEAVDVTVYYYPTTNSVVIMDKDGNEVPYTFSWVGYDNEVQYTTVDEFATCGYTWPDDKVKTDAPADLKAKYDELLQAIKDGGFPAAPENPSPAASEDPSPAASGDSSPAASENTTTAAPAATNAPTTASNQSTKTGDVAPVAILSLLVAAVAVVTVAAKKREA